MIEASYIEKKYPGTGVALYLRELNIGAGEIVGVLGANGSGKTTLLKAIMGISALSSGKLRVMGGRPDEHYEEMAYITEEGSFLQSMSPMDYGRFLSDFFPRFDHRRYQRLLEFYEVPRERKLRSFSKGQKLKVEISAGLAKSAKLIIMDEPFQGKDLLSRRELIRLAVSELHEEQTLLIATHLISEIENVIDRAIILHEGRLKADVQIDELREQGSSLTDALTEAAGHTEKRVRRVLEADEQSRS
ncbi:ATP-binding cassette domain-containing protein [Paenibacillus sp. 1P07SE]|uniref:ATP-binding cassette domain-containing protein n=1 Tax=Paenibacillus sp. 1P07SE TaxID=3132209 RepID=UPI0039A5A07D